MQKIYILVLFIFINTGLLAQKAQSLHELLPASSNTPMAMVIQDENMANLLVQQRNYNAKNKSIPGWRIQIYFATGKGAKEGAEMLRSKFLEEYPEQHAYITYFAPYFKVLVGNFRNKRDAAHFRQEIITEYKEAWLVKDKIKWPDL